jgi:predicted ester cyclase
MRSRLEWERFPMSHNADGTPTDSAEAANAAIGRRILTDVWGAGKLELVDEIVAPDYLDHTPRGPEPASVRGTAGIKEAVRMFRAAFPDLHYTVDFQIVQGDLVASRFTATGTHLGAFQGFPPTGRRVTYTGIDIARIVDGQIAEGWVNYDALGLLEQLGAVHAAGAKDT